VGDDRLDKAAVLRRADAAWEKWSEYVANEADAGRVAVRGADGWTLPEALAHVARWHVWGVGRIGQVLAGAAPEPLDVDGINERWMDEDREIGYEDAWGRQQAAWQRLRGAVEAVPDQRWNHLLTEIVKANTWEHYDEHMGWRPGAA